MNFLQPHPDTLRWWEQRQQCERCVNVRKREVGRRDMVSTVYSCKSAAFPGKREPYCIDARLPGQPCGPDAALFKEKT